MATVSIKKCDLCGSTEGVKRWMIGLISLRRPDLCSTCAVPLEEIERSLRDISPKRRRRTPVASIEEVVAARRKPPHASRKPPVPR